MRAEIGQVVVFEAEAFRHLRDGWLGIIGLAVLFCTFSGSELHSDPIAETLAQTVAPFRFHGGESAGAIIVRAEGDLQPAVDIAESDVHAQLGGFLFGKVRPCVAR